MTSKQVKGGGMWHGLAAHSYAPNQGAARWNHARLFVICGTYLLWNGARNTIKTRGNWRTISQWKVKLRTEYGKPAKFLFEDANAVADIGATTVKIPLFLPILLLYGASGARNTSKIHENTLKMTCQQVQKCLGHSSFVTHLDRF